MNRIKLSFIILLTALLTASAGLAQKAPVNTWVFVQSAQEYEKSNKGYWDVPGSPTGGSGDQNIQVWEKDGGVDRQYNFMNITGDRYHIHAGHVIKSHLVKMEATFKKNGANIRIEKKTGNGSDDIFNRQQFTFRYVGAGRWKIYSDDGRVICLDNRSSDNGVNVHLWEDHEGPWTEWVFIDAHTNNIIYPEFEPAISGVSAGGSVKDGRILETIQKLDNTYANLYKAEKIVLENFHGIKESKSIIDKSDHFVYEFDRLNTQLYALITVLKPINLIPYVNVVTKPISKGLEFVADPLETVNDEFEVIGEEKIKPAKEKVDRSNEIAYDYEAKFAYVLSSLRKMKEVYVQAAIAAEGQKRYADNFAAHAPMINKNLDILNRAAQNIQGDLAKINQMTKDLGAMKAVVEKVDNGLSKMSNAFNKTDKAASAIDGFMNKEFKAGPFSLSLQKVLDGDVIPAQFKKPVEDWKEKQIAKLKDKFNIELPTIPKVDEFLEKIRSIDQKTATVQECNNTLSLRLVDIQNAVAGLRMPLYQSISGIPYEEMKKSRLIELSRN